MAKIERTTNGAATKKTFEDKGTFKNPIYKTPYISNKVFYTGVRNPHGRSLYTIPCGIRAK